MKRIFMVRHAKSSWDDPSLRDIDRPLSKRGRRDAPFMAKLMVDGQPKPDALISSPARRAFDTARQFAKAWGWNKEDIMRDPEIYEAYHMDLLALIQRLEDAWDTVFIFGHNPAFTDFVNLFSGGGHIDNIPTCGIVALESTADAWKSFSTENSRVVQFYYPKQYLA